MGFKNLPPEIFSLAQALSKTQELATAQDKYTAAELITQQSEEIALLRTRVLSAATIIKEAINFAASVGDTTGNEKEFINEAMAWLFATASHPTQGTNETAVAHQSQ